MDCYYLTSRGASSKILLMWDRRVVENIEECVGEFTVVCSFINVDDHFTWALTGVSAPNFDWDRRFLWDELGGLLSWWLWCIG